MCVCSLTVLAVCAFFHALSIAIFLFSVRFTYTQLAILWSCNSQKPISDIIIEMNTSFLSNFGSANIHRELFVYISFRPFYESQFHNMSISAGGTIVDTELMIIRNSSLLL